MEKEKINIGDTVYLRYTDTPMIITSHGDNGYWNCYWKKPTNDSRNNGLENQYFHESCLTKTPYVVRVLNPNIQTPTDDNLLVVDISKCVLQGLLSNNSINLKDINGELLENVVKISKDMVEKLKYLR